MAEKVIKMKLNFSLKCYFCKKAICEKIIPIEQIVLYKWDDDWGIEVFFKDKKVIICLECFARMIR